MEHGKFVCSCGALISPECGCFELTTKALRTVYRGCAKCQAAARLDSVAGMLQAAGFKKPSAVDFTRATELTPEVEAAVHDAFEYHKWTPEQIEHGKRVRAALEMAVLQI